MAIYVGSQELSTLKIGDTDVSEVWVGDKLVWANIVDTGWLVPAYAGSSSTGGAGNINNPENVWSTNTGSLFNCLASTSSQMNAYSDAFLPPINASEVLQWGIKIKGRSGGQVYLTADFETIDAQDASAAPGDISKSGLGGIINEYGPSGTDWDSGAGDSTDYLGTSAAARAWWAGGAGFRAYVRDINSSTGSSAYTYQVRVIYKPSV